MRATLSFAVGAAFFVLTSMPLASDGTVTLVQTSTDPFTNNSSMHKTEVEPDILGVGSTLVSVFQVGRFNDGGASDIGFATSADAGAHWTMGFLPGITKIEHSGNPWDRASDPTVAFDAKHGLWLAATLPLLGTTGQTPVVSRSADGINWSNPVQVGPASVFGDKDWITCDDFPSSPHFGNCYVEYDDAGNGLLINMVTTSDGGMTWGPVRNTSDFASGIGGQPVVQPNGTVVVAVDDSGEANILSFTSTNGGASWGRSVLASSIIDHFANGNLRTEAFSSAGVDHAGNIFLIWQDCRFRNNCAENDIVMIVSSDGTHWSAPARVPIDATTSIVDHFIPGLAVNPSTAGAHAHLGITYYYYTNTNCSTCTLRVGFIQSTNGGATWRTPVKLTGPFNVTWCALTNQGYMVGDYQGTSYSGSTAFGMFAIAAMPSGGTFNEAMFTRSGGPSLMQPGFELSSYGERPVPHAHSDHPRRTLQQIVESSI
ncbi:MAG TPA: sialidase family protein [Candidatus Eremiobacteraceae bacterium]|jgi:hypothetical protein